MTPEIEKHLMANSNLSKREIITGNFLGGLAWGFGSVLGATVLIALIYGLLGVFNFIPFAGQIQDQIKDVSNSPVKSK